MDAYLTFLSQLLLFQGIPQEDISRLLRCSHAKMRKFEENQTVWEADSGTPPIICIVLSGSLFIMQEDWRGNRTIVGRIEAGEFLGEGARSAADWNVAKERPFPFSLAVQESTNVLLLDSKCAMTPCPKGCASHHALLHNMVASLMKKQVRLLYKMEYLSKHSIREKLMGYLTAASAQAGSSSFSIPYNRQELADFLSVDRSALSAELSRMQRDGLIRYRLNAFELL